MTARFGPRFGAESALIVGAAVVAYLLELSWPAVAAVVFGAWLAIALFEIVAAREPATEAAPAPASEPEADAVQEPPPSVDVPVAPPVPPPVAARPSPPLPPVPERPAAPAPPPPASVPAPEPAPPVPAPVLEAPVLEQPRAETPAAGRPLPRAESGRWNLWELERLARDQAGRDAVRDEERSFLLMYLREFADAEGRLPPEFDGLVRDSFGDLVAPAR